MELNSSPLVSFVVPCYKYGHFLAHCVNSICMQSYSNFEVLIMDNCSPDNTPDIAQSFRDGRIRYFRNESNIGAVQNFNKGLSLANGKYVWVLAADDYLRSVSVLDRYVNAMERNTKLAFAFCRAIEVHGEKEGNLVRWADCGEQDLEWSDRKFFPQIINGCCVVFSSVLTRKEYLSEVGFFPTSLSFADDWYVWSMLSMNYGAAYFAEPMICYRVHEDSLTSQQGRDYARLCAGDELSMLWCLRHQAELQHKGELRYACRKALVDRATDYLRGALLGRHRSITATQFEGILADRIQQPADILDIRNSVYRKMLEEIKTCLYVEEGSMELADEIAVFGELSCRAGAAGVPALREACNALLGQRLANRLRTKRHFTGTEFKEDLESHISDQQAVRDIRSVLYTEIGDQEFSNQEYENAKDCYKLAKQICPFRAITIVKYLLMKLGVMGIWIRHFSHQVRVVGRRS